MAILIKGMEMPKSCPCELAGIGYDVYCSFVHGIPARVREYDECCEKGTRPDWCPCIEVPEPHGRLGDLDELKTAFPCGEYVKTESVRATIDHMRTIIPASEEGEA